MILITIIVVVIIANKKTRKQSLYMVSTKLWFYT